MGVEALAALLKVGNCGVRDWERDVLSKLPGSLGSRSLSGSVEPLPEFGRSWRRERAVEVEVEGEGVVMLVVVMEWAVEVVFAGVVLGAGAGSGFGRADVRGRVRRRVVRVERVRGVRGVIFVDGRGWYGFDGR